MPKNNKKFDTKLVKDKEASLPNITSALPGRFPGCLSFSYLALFTLLYVALPSFVLSVFLLLRIGSPQSAYWVSMVVLLGIIFYSRDKLNIEDYIIIFCVLLISHFYAYICFDGSYDGFTYQQPAIRRIAAGFNPIYDGYVDLGRPPDVWSDQATYFPKAIWYFSATVTAAFGDIQIGKAYNLLLIFAALFFVLGSTNTNSKTDVGEAALMKNLSDSHSSSLAGSDGETKRKAKLLFHTTWLILRRLPAYLLIATRSEGVGKTYVAKRSFCFMQGEQKQRSIRSFANWDRVSVRALWITACLNPIALTQADCYLTDGVLGSLCTISLFYAYLFFNGKSITRLQHIISVVSLSMLFCVKASGFGFGSIIIFFIVLNGFVKKCSEKSELPSERFLAACKTALRLCFRMGVPVFLLVLVWGFAPYATNILNGKHIFYPLIYDGSERSGWVQEDAEIRAEVVYPNASNRFTRLLYSIASHAVIGKESAVIKHPFSVPLSDWKAFSQSMHITAAGLGPLFFLFIVLSVPFIFIYRFNGNGWLLLTLLTLTFIQPYSWAMRFAPFLWIIPLVCLMSLPEKRRALLWAPLIIAFVNTAGVSYFTINSTWQYSRNLNRICSPFVGEIVMLPQSIFEYHGIFDRYGVRQKYINPEDTYFVVDDIMFGSLPGDRSPNGVNIFLKSQLPSLPETTLVFAERAAYQRLRMSEGLAPFETMDSGYARKTRWLNIADKVKFYMSLDKEPKEDWELTLKGLMYDTKGAYDRELKALIFVNNREIGTWKIGVDSRTATFTIPLDIMEESFEDETHLVTLMLRLQRDDRTYGLQMEEMQFRQNN